MQMPYPLISLVNRQPQTLQGQAQLNFHTRMFESFGMIALATSEAMNLGMRLGVDPAVLQRCFSTSSGGSWVNDTVNPVPGVCPDAVTSKGYEGGFKVRSSRELMCGRGDLSCGIGTTDEEGHGPGHCRC